MFVREATRGVDEQTNGTVWDFPQSAIAGVASDNLADLAS